jgi:hypothetical protein
MFCLLVRIRLQERRCHTHDGHEEQRHLGDAKHVWWISHWENAKFITSKQSQDEV